MGFVLIVGGCVGEPAVIDTAASPTLIDSAVDSEADDVGGDTSDTGAPPDDTGDSAADEAAYAALYDVAAVTQVGIEMTAADESAMTAELDAALLSGTLDPDLSYFPATVTVNGEVLPNVGVRLQGGGSPVGWGEKPSLKVKFGAFDEPIRYAGLKRLVLDNMGDDPAMCRDVVGFHAWRSAGMPAPQANFAQVYLSIEGAAAVYVGLYANLEDVDSRWLERNYADDAGDLWEAGDSADFTERGLAHFSLVSGEGDTRALDEARSELQNHGDDFYAAADSVLDMDAFLRFWTYSVALGNRDGYPFHLNDFFAYLNPDDDRFHFTPATMEESFDSGTPLFARYVVGAIGQSCLYYDEACADRYLAALSSAITDVEGGDLGAFASTVQSLSATAMQDDARKVLDGESVTTSEVEMARARLNNRIAVYPELLRAGLGI